MSDKSQTLDLTELFIKTGIKAPLVQINDEDLMIRLARFLPTKGINKKKRDIISKIYNMCLDSDIELTSLSLVAEQEGMSVSTLRAYMNEFVKLGVVEVINCTTDPKNKRLGKLYRFTTPSLDSYVTELQEPTESEIIRTKMELEEIDLIRRTEFTDIAFCDLVTSVLFGAMRFNRKGNSNKIESHVVWGNERVAVETTSGKGERIALLVDLRYYIASITVLEQIIRERLRTNQPVPETYNIPLNSILDALNLSKTGGQKQSALNAIRRLSGTTFHIKSLPRWFLLRYAMTHNSALHLNIFNLRLEGESSEVPGSIVLQLQYPPETISQIKRQIDGETEAIHELTRTFTNALTTNNNLLFAFNLWTSNYFSETGMAIFDWLEMKDRTAPQLSINEFKKGFSKVLEEYRVPATSFRPGENGEQIEVIDEQYEPIYKNGIALKETSSILGIRVALENNSFVLLPEIQEEKFLLRHNL